MDAILLFKILLWGMFFAGGVTGCALGTLATKIMDRKFKGEDYV